VADDQVFAFTVIGPEHFHMMETLHTVNSFCPRAKERLKPFPVFFCAGYIIDGNKHFPEF
jgi:hypothetical protein